MKLSDYDYELPAEFIAQTPLEKRDGSKLLVYDRAADSVEIKHFYDIVDYLEKGDVVVINNTRVMPARLNGRKKSTGAAIELLLLKKLSVDTYSTLVKPLKRVKIGDCIVFDGLEAELVLKDESDGTAVVKFNAGGAELDSLIDSAGVMPLPHYIAEKLDDGERYQTVYGRVAGSAAAPTAGLHWTHELMERARMKGVIFCEVLLHVGLGTFRPVKTENITEHKMHSEFYQISPEAAAVINSAKKEGRRVICVGTTSLRTLEGCFAKNGGVTAGCGETDIFIYPPYQFRAASALVTNFHLPKSTLLMLVSAFAGREKTLKLYECAKAEGFRFFSFGDAMFIK